MEQYKKRLNTLFLKGRITEEEWKEKLNELETDFETKVKMAIQEIVDDGYVKKTIKRIYQEKKK